MVPNIITMRAAKNEDILCFWVLPSDCTCTCVGARGEVAAHIVPCLVNLVVKIIARIEAPNVVEH